MNLLALDLATHTGWASWTGEDPARGRAGILESGVQVCDVKRGESPGMRYLRFRRWLEDLANLISPELVVYEQPFVMRSGAAAEISLGFATRVQELCALRAIDHQPINGSQLKKWTTGRGNAKKPEMVAAVSRRWKLVTDDNEADAIALLQYARAELVPAGAGR